jgi:uncharacterized membrane protein
VTFAAPWALGLLALVPIVVALHLRRRRSLEVGSVMIWRRVAGTAGRARTRWAVPSSWLNLLLQVGAVIALTLALARPTAADAGPAHLVLVLDATQPMLAVDAAPQRFEAARGDALALLDALHGGTVVSVVAVGDRAHPVAVRLDPETARARITALAPSELRADWHDVASTLRGLVRDDERTSVHLWTSPQDAASVDAALASGAWSVTGAHARYVVGSAERFVNAGLTNVSLVPRAGGAGRWTIRGTLVSTGVGREPVQLRAFFRADGMPLTLAWGSTEVAPDRHGRADFSFPVDLPGDGVLELRLPGTDHLPSDDTVAVRVASTREAAALLIGPDNPALERALLAIPGLALYRADEPPSDTSAFDLVIVDRVELSRAPGTSTLWLATSPPGLSAGAGAGLGAAPAHPDGWRSDHALTRGIDWGTYELRASGSAPTGDGWEALVVTGDVTLVSARTDRHGRQVVAALDASAGAWPATSAFPAFVAAVVDWALPERTLTVPAACSVGRPCGLPPAAFAPTWQLLDADGEIVASPTGVVDAALGDTWWLEGAFDRQFVPARSGLYTLRTSADDVDVVVLPTPLVDAGAVPEGAASSASASGGDDLGRPWWQLAAWLALAAMAADAALAGLGRERWLRPDRWRSGESRPRFVSIATTTLSATVLVAIALAAVPWPSVVPTRHDAVVLGRLDAALVADALSQAPLAMPVGLRPLGADGDPGTPTAADLERGVALALASAAAGTSSNVAVVAPLDSLSTGTLQQLVRYAAGARTTLTVVPIVAPALDGVAFERLALPDTLRAGDSSELAVTVRNEGAEPVEVASRPGGRRAAPARGRGTGLGAPHRSGHRAGGAGAVELRLEARTASTDDLLAAVSVPLWVAEPTSVLLVALEPDSVETFAETLRMQRLEVAVDLPRRMPSTLEALSRYDVVVLVDVPAVALHTFHQELLERWVRERGGGVVLLGGESSFGAGGYLLTPLDTLSPLSARIPDEAPEVTMVFVLDRSGSMSAQVGEVTRLRVAQEATVSAFELLNPDSLVGLVAFDAGAEVIAPMTSARERDVLVAAVERLRAGGGTDIYVGLLAAEELLATVDSAALHVVVMTDGITQPGDFPGVLGRLRALGATTSIIGIGDGADRGQLQSLADMGGGNLHFTRDFRALPAIMAQETAMAATDAVERERVQPTWLEPRPRFSGTLPASAPPLGGYVRTTLKPAANLHLADVSLDAPLMASWRYGAGRVLAFTSDPLGPWGNAWREDPGYQPLWSQALRWTAGDVTRAGATVRSWYEGTTLHVATRVLDEDAEPVTGLRPTLTLRTGDDVATVVSLVEVRDGVYQTSVAVDPGAAPVTLTVDGGADAPFFVRRQERVAPAPVRLVDRTLDPSMPLERVALHLGLEVVTPEGLADVFSGGDRRLAWHGDGAPWLWPAVAVFVLSLLLRYGGLPRVLAWRASLSATRRGAVEREDEQHSWTGNRAR